MKSKYHKISIEWWDIKRSTIYRGVGFIVVLAVLVGGGWRLWRNNFFLPNPETKESPKDAARLFLFEGDVRIIRAATRETILVTREVFVSAGDTIQTQSDGRAQIQMIDGSTYSIRPNSTVVISDSSSIFGGTNVRIALNAVNNTKISPKERVIEPPKLIMPPNSEQFTVAADGLSDVSFRWQKSDAVAISAFHLQLAKSPFFVPDALVHERNALTNPNFTLGNLMPGTYYWRIRASAVSGQISDWSELSKFAIVKQTTNEPVTVSDWTGEKVGGNIYIIRGKTQSGAVVGVSERETFATGDGSFVCKSLQAGRKSSSASATKKAIGVVIL